MTMMQKMDARAGDRSRYKLQRRPLRGAPALVDPEQDDDCRGYGIRTQAAFRLERVRVPRGLRLTDLCIEGHDEPTRLRKPAPITHLPAAVDVELPAPVDVQTGAQIDLLFAVDEAGTRHPDPILYGTTPRDDIHGIDRGPAQIVPHRQRPTLRDNSFVIPAGPSDEIELEMRLDFSGWVDRLFFLPVSDGDREALASLFLIDAKVGRESTLVAASAPFPIALAPDGIPMSAEPCGVGSVLWLLLKNDAARPIHVRLEAEARVQPRSR